jgi:hypothetical protein
LCTFGEEIGGLRFVSMGSRFLSYAEDTQTEQIESGAAIHGALDKLQAVDVSFHGAVAPGLLKGGEQGPFVSLKMRGKIGERTGTGSLLPSRPSGRILFADHAEEFPRQTGALGDLR